MPLVRNRFASLHPHRLLACGCRCFPSLGFELPALTNRCRKGSPAPSALRPSGERRRPGARAGRRRDGTLRTAPPNGRARSSGIREDTDEACLSPHTLYSDPARGEPPPPPAHHEKRPCAVPPPALPFLRCLVRVRLSRLPESPLSSLPGGAGLERRLQRRWSITASQRLP